MFIHELAHKLYFKNIKKNHAGAELDIKSVKSLTHNFIQFKMRPLLSEDDLDELDLSDFGMEKMYAAIVHVWSEDAGIVPEPEEVPEDPEPDEELEPLFSEESEEESEGPVTEAVSGATTFE